MSKIRIEEVEYDTDTFNTEQMSLYNEIVYVSNLMAEKQYTLRSLEGRRAFLTKELTNSVSSKEKTNG